MIRLDGTPFYRRPNGTLVLNVMLTFVPGRDDLMIERLGAAQPGAVASTVLDMMRNGLESARIEQFQQDEELDLSGFAVRF